MHGRTRFAVVSLLCVLLVSPAASQTPGGTLAPHQPGILDIHHINTGEGSAAFLILPDGTTLLIDCGFGEAARPPRYKAPRRPDASRLPGEWIARYVKRVHPGGADAAVDFAVMTHFHGDHAGGLPEFLQHVRINTLLDRGWPDYGPPIPFKGVLAGRYRGAVQEQVRRHGMSVERFEAGRSDQIMLRHAPDRFPDFEVRNLAVNGKAWTGTGTNIRTRLDLSAITDENACSAALRLTYGRFDYYTGGDLPGEPAADGSPGRDMESAIAWVTGPVDVAVLNHHGNSDGSNPFFLSVLRPRVAIVNTWAARQVDPTTLARLRSEQIYPGPRDVFTTNGMWDGRAEHIIQVFGETIGRQHLEDLKWLAGDQGHIVVRVAPKGDSYHVILLNDSDEAGRIRSVHGPYRSQ
jgi:hypothetical protein